MLGWWIGRCACNEFVAWMTDDARDAILSERRILRPRHDAANRSGNNYFLNPSLEADRVAITQPAGWTTSNGSNVTGGHSGRWAWQLTGNANLTQAVSNLPSGSYTLSAWVKSGTAGAQLSAKGFGGTDKSVAIAAATAWTSVSVSGIAVSNGKCEVRVTSSGQTVTVDDFALIKD